MQEKSKIFLKKKKITELSVPNKLIFEILLYMKHFEILTVLKKLFKEVNCFYEAFVFITGAEIVFFVNNPGVEDILLRTTL